MTTNKFNKQEQRELQNILIEYIENPKKMGTCIDNIENLFHQIHSRWNGFRYELRSSSIVDKIMNEIAAKHNVTVDQIKSLRRAKYISKAREEIIMRLYKNGFTYAEISKATNKHTSSIIYVIAKVKSRNG